MRIIIIITIIEESFQSKNTMIGDLLNMRNEKLLKERKENTTSEIEKKIYSLEYEK